jgi:hypothetical protein
VQSRNRTRCQGKDRRRWTRIRSTVRLCCTCWWHSLCNLEYWSNCTKTCLDHVGSWMDPRNFFHLFLVCLTDMTTTIARFFQWLTLSGTPSNEARKDLKTKRSGTGICRNLECAWSLVHVVHVGCIGCTRCVPSSTDNTMKRRAGITSTVACIRVFLYVYLMFEYKDE